MEDDEISISNRSKLLNNNDFIYIFIVRSEKKRKKLFTQFIPQNDKE